MAIIRDQKTGRIVGGGWQWRRW